MQPVLCRDFIITRRVQYPPRPVRVVRKYVEKTRKIKTQYQWRGVGIVIITLHVQNVFSELISISGPKIYRLYFVSRLCMKSTSYGRYFNLTFCYLLYNLLCGESVPDKAAVNVYYIFIFYKIIMCVRFILNPSVVFSKFSKPSRTRRALGLRPLYFERGANTGVWIQVENCRVDIPSVGGVCSHK